MTVLDDPELESAVLQLATALDRPASESIRIAVEEKLQRVSQARIGRIDWEAIRAIQRRVAEMPLLDTSSDDEILGYNENGLFE